MCVMPPERKSDRWPPARTTEHGSALMLVPAGFLVLMLFAAIAVDSAAAYLAQRQMTDALAAAANDAVTAGLDNSTYYATGSVVLDPVAAGRVICTSLVAQDDHDLHHLAVAMGLSGSVIRLRGTADVDAVFGRLIPRFGTRIIAAEVTADAQRGPQRSSTVPARLTPLRC